MGKWAQGWRNVVGYTRKIKCCKREGERKEDVRTQNCSVKMGMGNEKIGDCIRVGLNEFAQMSYVLRRKSVAKTELRKKWRSEG